MVAVLAMMPFDVPALGIRFDVALLNESSYGVASWRIFWKAIDPHEIRGSELYEGDTGASIAGRENVFCIAIQNRNAGILGLIKARLSNDPAFNAVCAPPRFVSDTTCVSEPLVRAGAINERGELVGDAWNCRPAMASAGNGEGSRVESVRSDGVSGPAPSALSHVVVFKNGGRPKDEQWYLKQVFGAIGLLSSDLVGTSISLRHVQTTNLDQAYVVGFATQSGHDLNDCSLVPFSDADGGTGMILKVKRIATSRPLAPTSSKRWWQLWK
jgi:hypothetical protein